MYARLGNGDIHPVNCLGKYIIQLYNVKDSVSLRSLDLMPYRQDVFYTAKQTAVYIIKDKLFSRVAIRHLFKDPAGVIAACSILE